MQRQLTQHRSNSAGLSWFSHFSGKGLAKFLFYFVLAWQYSGLFWLGEKNAFADTVQVYGRLEKPYVYRQLVPLLARLLVWLGIQVDLALVIVVAISAVWAILIIGNFLREFHVKSPEHYELIAACVLFVFLLKDVKVYDFATVATFSFSLIALHRRQFWQYHFAFFLACLNRETALLLIVFFTCHFFRGLEPKVYILNLLVQLAVFLSIRILMLYAFQSNPGVSAQFNFFQNMRVFFYNPFWTLVQLVIFVGAGWMVIQTWSLMPKFLQHVILTFSLPLVVFYLVFGVSFELRVFLELFPALFVVIGVVAEKKRNLMIGKLKNKLLHAQFISR